MLKKSQLYREIWMSIKRRKKKRRVKLRSRRLQLRR
jgi:hypothetical protein